MACRRCRHGASRRSADSRSTAVCPSGTTWRRSSRVAAISATLSASMPSVLRPWPVRNRRARAANEAGTSMTVSPAASSCWASSLPSPSLPSTAQRRSGQPLASMALRGSFLHQLVLLALSVCDDCGWTRLSGTAPTLGSMTRRDHRRRPCRQEWTGRPWRLLQRRMGSWHALGSARHELGQPCSPSSPSPNS